MGKKNKRLEIQTDSIKLTNCQEEYKVALISSNECSKQSSLARFVFICFHYIFTKEMCTIEKRNRKSKAVHMRKCHFIHQFQDCNTILLNSLFSNLHSKALLQYPYIMLYKTDCFCSKSFCDYLIECFISSPKKSIKNLHFN